MNLPQPLGLTTATSATTRALLTMFMTGEMRPGDRLPPERQLAESLGVGRSAVREALAALELLGVVTVRPGSGTYLRGGASDLLQQALSWGLLLGEDRLRDLIEVRHALEVRVARLAATRVSREQLAELEMTLSTMEESRTDYATFVAADVHFHEIVEAAAHNAVMVDLLQSARALIRVWMERALADSFQAELTIQDHRGVFVALQRGDADEAAAAMDHHLDTARQRLLGEAGN